MGCGSSTQSVATSPKQQQQQQQQQQEQLQRTNSSHQQPPDASPEIDITQPITPTQDIVTEDATTKHTAMQTDKLDEKAKAVFAKPDRLVKLQQEHKAESREDKLDQKQLSAQLRHARQLEQKAGSKGKHKIRRDNLTANVSVESLTESDKSSEPSKSNQTSDTDHNKGQILQSSRVEVFVDTPVDSEDEQIVLENDTYYNRQVDDNVWEAATPSQPGLLESGEPDPVLIM